MGSPTLVKVEVTNTLIADGQKLTPKDGHKLVVIDISSPVSYDDLESDPLLADEDDIPDEQGDDDTWSRLDSGMPPSPYPMGQEWIYLDPFSDEGKKSKRLRYVYELEDEIDSAYLYIDDYKAVKIDIE